MTETQAPPRGGKKQITPRLAGEEYEALRTRSFTDRQPQETIVRRALRKELGLPALTELRKPTP